MIFYFQQMYYFKLSLCFPPFMCLGNHWIIQIFTINALCTCLAEQTRAALKWPFLCFNCSHQPVFTL